MQGTPLQRNELRRSGSRPADNPPPPPAEAKQKFGKAPVPEESPYEDVLSLQARGIMNTPLRQYDPGYSTFMCAQSECLLYSIRYWRG